MWVFILFSTARPALPLPCSQFPHFVFPRLIFLFGGGAIFSFPEADGSPIADLGPIGRSAIAQPFHFTNYLFRIPFRISVAPSGRPGVDVMITIFCYFRQFLAKKLAFFTKTNVMIKILHNLPLF
jgi:hypothetical protein